MLVLRPTTPDDLRELSGWEQEPDTSTWLGETGPAWHTRALADPDQEHLITTDGDALVGFAVLAGLRGGNSIELRRMVVAPGHRGAGRGRTLLEAVLARAYAHHGVQNVWLDVKSHNVRARSLYESAGFVVRETLTKAIVDPDGTISDLVIMAHQHR